MRRGCHFLGAFPCMIVSQQRALRALILKTRPREGISSLQGAERVLFEISLLSVDLMDQQEMEASQGSCPLPTSPGQILIRSHISASLPLGR